MTKPNTALITPSAGGAATSAEAAATSAGGAAKSAGGCQPSLDTGHYPGRAPFDAYGNGGFRFASMSHRGSLIALPSGIGAWSVTKPEELTLASLARVFAEPRGGDFQFLLLGTGASQVFPPAEIVRACLDAGIGLDVMSTGAACRTYNVLLSEGRPVGAAVIAVDT
jgi:uncharacterized protein